MSKNKKNYKATDKGYKEEDEEVEELKETVPTKAEQKEIEALSEENEEGKTTSTALELENDLSVPYSDLGYSVSQLAGMEPQKRLVSLGPEKDKEFSKKYHL